MHAPELTGYNVHPPSDRTAMLGKIGVDTIEDLWTAIPSTVRLRRSLNLPAPRTEWNLRSHLESLARLNQHSGTMQSYLGGGAYEHSIPETVRSLAARGEFLTAYTPYQPEMSQGVLRVLHDFQRLMAQLLGQTSVNCSVYDGATALAEATWMACRATDRKRLIVSAALWPEYRAVLDTYCRGRGVEIVTLPSAPDSGQIDIQAVEPLLQQAPAAAVVLQTPNRYGVIEGIQSIAKLTAGTDALTIVSCYPVSLGCLRSPGEAGADIVACEAQSLGLELNAGGPYLGVIATRPELEEHLPGRLVGVCNDLKGEPALALVKEEREQHVARHQATSHICSNQAHLALRATIHLATLGEQGFRAVAQLCAAKAHYLCDKLQQIEGVQTAKSGPFFNEFLIELPQPPTVVLPRLRDRGVFGGIDVSTWEPDLNRHLLIAVTEVKSKAELDFFAQELAATLSASTH